MKTRLDGLHREILSQKKKKKKEKEKGTEGFLPFLFFPLSLPSCDIAIPQLGKK
jgi:hypothetical protein